MVLEQLYIYIEKHEPRHRSLTIHKNKLKMYRRPKCKVQSYKTSRRKMGEKSGWPYVWL